MAGSWVTAVETSWERTADFDSVCVALLGEGLRPPTERDVEGVLRDRGIWEAEVDELEELGD